jgi:hypothetical protein
VSNYSWSPFNLASIKQYIITRIPPIFEIEKLLWKSELCCFSTFNFKTIKKTKNNLWSVLYFIDLAYYQLNSAACRKISEVTLIVHLSSLSLAKSKLLFPRTKQDYWKVLSHALLLFTILHKWDQKLFLKSHYIKSIAPQQFAKHLWHFYHPKYWGVAK